ncbi:uncharacterized protein LY79DRAFT_309457 [Colletotrichum navitas]|uniref:Uncharacterized protein n=1 Tax=Colletotrichum navitas TaxID=681940 RepID=A0AAD8V0J2_9PEZI|nr:uncharacterized protein LY79DRAFT_309457 [Colletotrichum navitas]KAK1580310.1 hypothetical protein LY79DRAFT_309457 [Colletotrichum navitas]
MDFPSFCWRTTTSISGWHKSETTPVLTHAGKWVRRDSCDNPGSSSTQDRTAVLPWSACSDWSVSTDTWLSTTSCPWNPSFALSFGKQQSGNATLVPEPSVPPAPFIPFSLTHSLRLSALTLVIHVRLSVCLSVYLHSLPLPRKHLLSHRLRTSTTAPQDPPDRVFF